MFYHLYQFLNSKDEKELIDNLEKLNFSIKPSMDSINAISKILK